MKPLSVRIMAAVTVLGLAIIACSSFGIPVPAFTSSLAGDQPALPNLQVTR